MDARCWCGHFADEHLHDGREVGCGCLREGCPCLSFEEDEEEE